MLLFEWFKQHNTWKSANKWHWAWSSGQYKLWVWAGGCLCPSCEKAGHVFWQHVIFMDNSSSLHSVGRC